MFPSLPYLAQRLFCFFVIRLLVCIRAFYSYLLVEFFSLFVCLFFWVGCKLLFCLYCFILSRYLFSPPSLVSIFWFIFTSCIDCFTCWMAFFFLSQHVPAHFLCLFFFACCRIFLICVSSRTSHPDFEFLFMFFRRTPILSQTNFTPA